MHLEGYQDVFFIITYGLAIVMLSSLATWKNRNPLGWGLIGGLFFPTSFLCLLLESHLCPKCKASLSTDKWRLRKCPTCGKLARRMKHDRSLIPAHEGTV
jgi:hypothetical protein